jgi:small subunit ribosomal protein S17
MAEEEKQIDDNQAAPENPPAAVAAKRGRRVQKIGIVASDKMQKTVVVRVDRVVLHRKYRRYVRRTSKFMAHDEVGSTVGDKVRIVETRPLSARKRWRVVEILQKAAK